MVTLLLNFHANTDHKESLEKRLAVPAGHFCISYLGHDGRERQSDKLKILTILPSLKLQLSQWYSSYATFQFCLKIEVRFGGNV